MNQAVDKNSIEKRFSAVSRSKTFLNIVDALHLKGKQVLDIGCSYGEFLAHFGAGSVGLTIVQEEVDYGRSRGLDVRLCNIESDTPKLPKFDAIFANNIFEHLYSPHAFLIKIKQYLKPNGILILGVPCIPKAVSLLHLRKFRGSLAEAHVNFFTRETLIKTVERGGYDIQSARGFRLPEWLDFLLNPIYPHFYIVARTDPHFGYTQKKMKELAGYE